MGVGDMAFLDGLGKVFDLDRGEDVPVRGDLRTAPEDLLLRLWARDGKPQVILVVKSCAVSLA
jgi:hypothetical protein